MQVQIENEVSRRTQPINFEYIKEQIELLSEVRQHKQNLHNTMFESVNKCTTASFYLLCHLNLTLDSTLEIIKCLANSTDLESVYTGLNMNPTLTCDLFKVLKSVPNLKMLNSFGTYLPIESITILSHFNQLQNLTINVNNDTIDHSNPIFKFIQTTKTLDFVYLSFGQLTPLLMRQLIGLMQECVNVVGWHISCPDIHHHHSVLRMIEGLRGQPYIKEFTMVTRNPNYMYEDMIYDMLYGIFKSNDNLVVNVYDQVAFHCKEFKRLDKEIQIRDQFSIILKSSRLLLLMDIPIDLLIEILLNYVRVDDEVWSWCGHVLLDRRSVGWLVPNSYSGFSHDVLVRHCRDWYLKHTLEG
ncbi:hypothetical protein BC833DRAFT_588691 [Globomyces pollinis-pini]|nr:hypothetical protein BC833DRAFT_588691 [Globomyces pollinis-pini]